jgi:hypothetical protein
MRERTSPFRFANAVQAIEIQRCDKRPVCTKGKATRREGPPTNLRPSKIGRDVVTSVVLDSLSM